MEKSPSEIFIPENILEQMLRHVLACLPEEACGLLGGSLVTGQASECFPIENELHSPYRFRMNPSEQLEAFYEIEQKGQDLVAFFHSHPQGPSALSPTDLEEFAYPGVLALIWAPEITASQPEDPEKTQFTLRAFTVEGILSSSSPYHEVPIHVNPA